MAADAAATRVCLRSPSARAPAGPHRLGRPTSGRPHLNVIAPTVRRPQRVRFFTKEVAAAPSSRLVSLRRRGCRSANRAATPSPAVVAAQLGGQSAAAAIGWQALTGPSRAQVPAPPPSPNVAHFGPSLSLSCECRLGARFSSGKSCRFQRARCTLGGRCKSLASAAAAAASVGAAAASDELSDGMAMAIARAAAAVACVSALLSNYFWRRKQHIQARAHTKSGRPIWWPLETGQTRGLSRARNQKVGRQPASQPAVSGI